MVHLIMFGWIPVMIAIFAMLPVHRAILTSMLAGWLFLPIKGYQILGLPNYDKYSATCMGTFMMALLFDPKQRLLLLRPTWLDLPVAIWCAGPTFTALNNDLGLYAGLTDSFRHFIAIGMPYLLGRAYFKDLEMLRELAIAVLIAGLIYVPFCLFEARFSPHLHKWIYGFHPTSFREHRRLGGFRPMVFMGHGLMLGLWMGNVALVGFWLWSSRTLKSLWGIPLGFGVVVLILTTILCKSTFAIFLCALGMAVLLVVRYMRVGLVLLVLTSLPLFYMATRAVEVWDAGSAIALASYVGNRQAGSLSVRLDSEGYIIDVSKDHPWLGGGRYARKKLSGRVGRQIKPRSGHQVLPGGFRVSIESHWMIQLLKYGWVGLMASYLFMLIPAILVWRRIPVAYWRHPQVAPVVVLALVLLMFACDNLMNDMHNPIYMLVGGGVLSVLSGMSFSSWKKAESQTQEA